MQLVREIKWEKQTKRQHNYLKHTKYIPTFLWSCPKKKKRQKYVYTYIDVFTRGGGKKSVYNTTLDKKKKKKKKYKYTTEMFACQHDITTNTCLRKNLQIQRIEEGKKT